MNRKLLSILLVAFMIMAIISGCSGAKDTKDTTQDTPGSTSGDSSSGDDDGFEFQGYPMDAKDVTITWWVGHGFTLNEAFATYEESPFHMGLRKKPA